MAISLSVANFLYSWGWRASMFGAVITAVGVGALFLGTRVRDHDFEGQVGHLNLEAANARERAAKSELELAHVKQFAGPRMLNPIAFKEALEGKPKARVAIWYVPETSDGWTFAFNLQVALLTAGWQADSPIPIPEPDQSNEFLRMQPRTMAAGGQPSGVTVVAPAGTNFETDAPYKALFDALSKSTDRGMYGGGSQFMPVPKGTLRVVVAAKSDPIFKLPDWMGGVAHK